MCSTKLRKKNKYGIQDTRDSHKEVKENSQDDDEGKSQSNNCAVGLVTKMRVERYFQELPDSFQCLKIYSSGRGFGEKINNGYIESLTKQKLRH
jgi:hypothetical protein